MSLAFKAGIAGAGAAGASDGGASVDFEATSHRGPACGTDQRGAAGQRTGNGKSRGTRGFLLPSEAGPPQQDGCGLCSASARAEHGLEGPQQGGQGGWATDGPSAVHVRGFKVDLTRATRGKSYTEQIIPHVPVSERCRRQSRANRFLGAKFRIDRVSVVDGLALLRQARDMMRTLPV